MFLNGPEEAATDAVNQFAKQMDAMTKEDADQSEKMEENNNEKSLLASFTRHGKKSPLDKKGFYSFIEDWNSNSSSQSKTQFID